MDKLFKFDVDGEIFTIEAQDAATALKLANSKVSCQMLVEPGDLFAWFGQLNSSASEPVTFTLRHNFFMDES